MRQLVHGVHALLAMGEKGCVEAHFRGVIRRSRFRIRDDRWNDLSGPSAWSRRKRGTQNQAIGRSRGGLTTKIGALVDALGNLVAFVLAPGQRHDVKLFATLMEGVTCGAFIGDKAFDSNQLHKLLSQQGIEAVIPPRQGTRGRDDYDREKYKWRHLIENFFCRIKAFRRIATRYEKTANCFAAMIHAVNIAIVPI